jgi:hypothetical protein
LEILAQDCVKRSSEWALTSLGFDIDKWAQLLCEAYHRDVAKSSWVFEPELFEFYSASGAEKSTSDMSLAKHGDTGFW